MGIFAAKKEIVPDTVIQRKNDLLFSEIQDEIVALNVETSEYIGFNAVASRIWTLIQQPISLMELVNKLTDEYDVTPERAMTDSLNFLEKLQDKKLITLK